MMLGLRSMHLAGFGCLADRRFLFGEGVTIFVGAPGSGKTTLLEAIRALFYTFGSTGGALRGVDPAQARFRPFDRQLPYTAAFEMVRQGTVLPGERDFERDLFRDAAGQAFEPAPGEGTDGVPRTVHQTLFRLEAGLADLESHRSELLAFLTGILASSLDRKDLQVCLERLGELERTLQQGNYPDRGLFDTDQVLSSLEAEIVDGERRWREQAALERELGFCRQRLGELEHEKAILGSAIHLEEYRRLDETLGALRGLDQRWEELLGRVDVPYSMLRGYPESFERCLESTVRRQASLVRLEILTTELEAIVAERDRLGEVMSVSPWQGGDPDDVVQVLREEERHLVELERELSESRYRHERAQEALLAIQRCQRELERRQTDLLDVDDVDDEALAELDFAQQSAHEAKAHLTRTTALVATSGERLERCEREFLDVFEARRAMAAEGQPDPATEALLKNLREEYRRHEAELVTLERRTEEGDRARMTLAEERRRLEDEVETYAELAEATLDTVAELQAGRAELIVLQTEEASILTAEQELQLSEARLDERTKALEHGLDRWKSREELEHHARHVNEDWQSLLVHRAKLATSSGSIEEQRQRRAAIDTRLLRYPLRLRGMDRETFHRLSEYHDLALFRRLQLHERVEETTGVRTRELRWAIAVGILLSTSAVLALGFAVALWILYAGNGEAFYSFWAGGATAFSGLFLALRLLQHRHARRVSGETERTLEALALDGHEHLQFGLLIETLRAEAAVADFETVKSLYEEGFTLQRELVAIDENLSDLVVDEVALCTRIGEVETRLLGYLEVLTPEAFQQFVIRCRNDRRVFLELETQRTQRAELAARRHTLGQTLHDLRRRRDELENRLARIGLLYCTETGAPGQGDTERLRKRLEDRDRLLRQLALHSGEEDAAARASVLLGQEMEHRREEQRRVLGELEKLLDACSAPSGETLGRAERALSKAVSLRREDERLELRYEALLSAHVALAEARVELVAVEDLLQRRRWEVLFRTGDSDEGCDLELTVTRFRSRVLEYRRVCDDLMHLVPRRVEVLAAIESANETLHCIGLQLDELRGNLRQRLGEDEDLPFEHMFDRLHAETKNYIELAGRRAHLEQELHEVRRAHLEAVRQVETETRELTELLTEVPSEKPVLPLEPCPEQEEILGRLGALHAERTKLLQRRQYPALVLRHAELTRTVALLQESPSWSGESQFQDPETALAEVDADLIATRKRFQDTLEALREFEIAQPSSPARLRERRGALLYHRRGLERRIEQVRLARKQLQESRWTLANRYEEMLSSAASEALTGLSKNVRYRLEVDRHLGLMWRENGADPRPLEYLGRVGRAQAWVALRLACLRLATNTVQVCPPVLLDDPFSGWDDERALAGLEAFASLADRVQVVLATSDETLVRAFLRGHPGGVVQHLL